MTNTNELQQIHDMREKLKSMGASEEEIMKLWIAALETADKIIKEATK